MDWLKRIAQKLPVAGASTQAKPRVTLRDLRIRGKIVSVGMHPEAAGAVAPFLAQFGLAQADGSHAEWSRAWFEGNFESIFASPGFTAAAVHEGAPFWFPDFYRHLHHRLPGSRFVLMLADPDAWFRALLARSGGFAAGAADVHAKVFRREDELRWLQKNIPGFAGSGHLVLHDSPAHYKAAYARHAAGVQQFFQARKADLLFVGRPDDPSSLHKLAEWLRLPRGAGAALATAGAEMPELSKEALLKPAVGAGSPGPGERIEG